ncbi:Emopamil-binding protein [Ascodesmis nigricans]|uniref:Emopamil-binding protein n=1 Tax=Ascodesmis nigricans TaxID=341454 RepID=A0A4S2N078_9PEZI|nr:Emopamil-binding protein [Ascodesmis nigricans]
MSSPTPSLITPTTINSFLGVFTLLFLSYALSLRLLPSSSTTKLRLIFIWHLFDLLIHLIFEGSFLYHSLFTSSAVPSSITPTLFGTPHTSYGAKFSSAPFAKLWQEYALADKRWEVADVGVVSLELLTVVVGGPLAGWICVMLVRGERRVWWWVTVLATAELYGGWMTFAPEWLSGSGNLVTSWWVYTYIYLLFFNGLWVVIPVWLLFEAYQVLVNTGPTTTTVTAKKNA